MKKIFGSAEEALGVDADGGERVRKLHVLHGPHDRAHLTVGDADAAGLGRHSVGPLEDPYEGC